MKREIKFRAWDKEKHCWYEPIHEAYKGNLFELLVGFGGDLSAHTMNGMIHESMWPDRFELMQFTGLKDRNGTEIYEGDILSYHSFYEGDWYNQSGIGYVIWDEEGHSIAIRGNNGEELYLCSTWDIAKNYGGEVIGNIYENPELLS